MLSGHSVRQMDFLHGEEAAMPQISQSEPIYTVSIQRDIKITMRDGVRLSANLFLPDADGPFPLIFQRMPYGQSGSHLGTYYARRGYAYMIQDCRGRYDSEGVFYPFLDDARDGYDTLEWVVQQPWSNERVGMFGPSYLGGVQWLLACEGHPALQAIVPNVVPCDFWKEGYWHSGAFSLALNALWTCLEISSRTSDLDMIPAYDLNAFFRHLPLSDFDEAAGVHNQFWRDFLAHAEYSPYWEQMGVHTRFDKIQVPAYIMCGWYDYYPRDAFKAFNRLCETASTDEIRRRRKIIMGPWSHLISLGRTLGEVDFGADSHLDIDALALRWFDCLLKDLDTGILDEPPVTIFVMGANEWRQEHEWPLARTQYTNYYLHQDGLLDPTPPGDEIPDSYLYDPDNPVPTCGGNHSICWGEAFHIIQPGPFDQRGIEARDDVLVYTTPPMMEPFEVTGPITLILNAATDAPDTDWVARLIDVSPDGRAINLTEGIIRARFRKSLYQPPVLLQPGEVYEYTIELLPTSNVFLPGHRLRIDITSSCFPLWDRNPNTGHVQGADAELRIARQTVYHDVAHLSYLILPIIQS